MMKAQVNVEFIVSASLTIMIFGYIVYSVMNNIPVLHRESVYEIEKADAFRITQLMISSPGIWKDNNISTASMMGLTDGVPFVLNETKVSALNCTESSYAAIHHLLGLENNNNFALNITEINLGGGADEKIVQCNKSQISLSSSMFWINRIAVINQSGKMNLVKIEFAIY
jgi:hypothetical protein